MGEEGSNGKIGMSRGEMTIIAEHSMQDSCGSQVVPVSGPTALEPRLIARPD